MRSSILVGLLSLLLDALPLQMRLRALASVALQLAVFAVSAADGSNLILCDAAALLAALLPASLQMPFLLLLLLLLLLLQLAMRGEAERLSGASFGVTLLHCIGRVYSRQADIYLGGLLGERHDLRS
jgi:hypothetical protein